jgi:hypothetical protein
VFLNWLSLPSAGPIPFQEGSGKPARLSLSRLTPMRLTTWVCPYMPNSLSPHTPRSAAAAASRCCCWVSRTRSIFALRSMPLWGSAIYSPLSGHWLSECCLVLLLCTQGTYHYVVERTGGRGLVGVQSSNAAMGSTNGKFPSAPAPSWLFGFCPLQPVAEHQCRRNGDDCSHNAERIMVGVESPFENNL